MDLTNRQWLIADRPIGRDLRETDFTWNEGAVRSPDPGEVLVRVRYLGFDPAQKGWMENKAIYMAPTEIGQPMIGFGLGEIIESRDASLSAGDLVTGLFGWQDYATVAVSPAGAAKKEGFSPLEKVEKGPYARQHLSVLGITGLTAFFGLHKVGKLFPGDTVVITGAAGATGSTVGQIAKIAGCRVIGIAGGPEKCRWLTESVGFDAAIDYRAGGVAEELAKLAPDGIDVVWDNVGGSLLNDLLGKLAMRARVVICGGISIYEAQQPPPGPGNYFNLIPCRATMGGFLIVDHEADFPWARTRIRSWLSEGKLTSQEDVTHGLSEAPRTLMRLFAGRNLGKQLLELEP